MSGLENIQVTTECLKSINHIGSTAYQNVCNGEFYTVPWGAGDWILGGLLGVLLVGVLVMLVAVGAIVIVSVIRD